MVTTPISWAAVTGLGALTLVFPSFVRRVVGDAGLRLIV
jgi:hypothetical protein